MTSIRNNCTIHLVLITVFLEAKSADVCKYFIPYNTYYFSNLFCMIKISCCGSFQNYPSTEKSFCFLLRYTADILTVVPGER